MSNDLVLIQFTFHREKVFSDQVTNEIKCLVIPWRAEREINGRQDGRAWRADGQGGSARGLVTAERGPGGWGPRAAQRQRPGGRRRSGTTGMGCSAAQQSSWGAEQCVWGGLGRPGGRQAEGSKPAPRDKLRDLPRTRDLYQQSGERGCRGLGGWPRAPSVGRAR